MIYQQAGMWEVALEVECLHFIAVCSDGMFTLIALWSDGMFTLIALWSDGNKTEECDNTLCLS
jgi:hypothetical protein